MRHEDIDHLAIVRRLKRKHFRRISSVEKYMKVVAKRTKAMYGVTVNTNNPRAFLRDLRYYGILRKDYT